MPPSHHADTTCGTRTLPSNAVVVGCVSQLWVRRVLCSDMHVYMYIYCFAHIYRTRKCTHHTYTRCTPDIAGACISATFSRDSACWSRVALLSPILSLSRGARTCVHGQTCCYYSSSGVISLTHRAPIFISEVIHEASSSSLLPYLFRRYIIRFHED